jgi:hypothetical protein
MTRPTRFALLYLALLLACSCSAGEPTASVVIQRCGERSLDSLGGTYGRLDGGQSINSRFRIRIDREGENTTARYVAGGHERFAMTGRRTGSETMELVEDGADGSRRRRLKLSLNAQCRLQAEDGWISGTGEARREQDHPSEPYTFVPFDLSRLDFEPCSERLAIGKAARGRTPGRLSGPGEVPVITSSTLPVAQWSPRAQLPQGCSALVSLWVNGEAEVLDFPIDSGGSTIHWAVDYDARFLGKKGLALHRRAKCGDDTRILGVACAQIEVR